MRTRSTHAPPMSGYFNTRNLKHTTDAGTGHTSAIQDQGASGNHDHGNTSSSENNGDDDPG